MKERPLGREERRSRLKRIVQWFEAAFTAAAFAEEDESDTARELLGEAGRRGEPGAPRRRGGEDAVKGAR